MDTRLYVAAGGGGDALAAAMLHAASAPNARAVVATYAWDRLLIDPLPGPRPARDFTGLAPVGANLWQVTAQSAPVPPAGSSLPRMAAELDAQLLLLDPYLGGAGMGAALAEAVRVFTPSRVTLVDVGGDVLARGPEAELKSPLADLLALSCCARLDAAEVDVAVLGVGLDGELPPAYTRERIAEYGGRPGPRLEVGHVDAIAQLLSWHPSEASGMLAASAGGVRGTVEVRDAGSHIALGEDSPDSWLMPAAAVAAGCLLTEPLAATETLEQVEAVVRSVCGRSELDYERRKAAALGQASTPTQAGELSERYARFVREGAARGSDYVTIRRMAESIGAPRGAGFEAWRAALIAAEPGRYARPLWSLRPA